ncbi:MAG: RNA methyltransferase [Anaerolineae bacterium]|nr:RNA methyltransferase [Anaerolineae bacterium]
MDAISSAQNKRVRYVKSLQTKARLRRSERKLVLEGDRLIADALSSGGRPSLALYSLEHADFQVIAALQEAKCELLPVSSEVLSFASDTQQPPGILAVFAIPKPPIPHPSARVLILDAVREPGNLGTIMRTAAAAGVKLAILAPGCVDPYNSKVLRAGMGAHFRLPVVEASWPEIANFCQDLTVYASSVESDCDYAAVDWQREWALILGNEARGVSQKARKVADKIIAIPMSDAAESINVASAAAVFLFEARRQRRRPSAS